MGRTRVTMGKFRSSRFRKRMNQRGKATKLFSCNGTIV